MSETIHVATELRTANGTPVEHVPVPGVQATVATGRGVSENAAYKRILRWVGETEGKSHSGFPRKVVVRFPRGKVQRTHNFPLMLKALERAEHVRFVPGWGWTLTPSGERNQ